ncbi:hypothetical protein IF650_02665 [Cellulosimicrobium terreum]|nr:hypothetical protein [Cellulosimicrobium terreum]
MLISLGVVLVALGATVAVAPHATVLSRGRWRRFEGRGPREVRDRRLGVRMHGLAVVLVGVAVAGTGGAGAERAAPGPERAEASAAQVPRPQAPAVPSGFSRASGYEVVGSSGRDLQAVARGAEEGDLVIQVAPAGCDVAQVRVQESPTTVLLAVVVEPGPAWLPLADPWADPPFGAPGTGAARCTDRISGSEPVREAELVHVPLRAPLGGREVVDWPTGTQVPPAVTAGAED